MPATEPSHDAPVIGQVDRSDQINQNSRALLSLPGVRVKQAAKHLFTMSKDPATRFDWTKREAKLALCATLCICGWFLVEPDGIEPTT
jgi:hypothetical protein